MDQVNDNTKAEKWKQLSGKERYKIEVLAHQGYSAAKIGSALNPKRNRRTIEREIARGLTLQRKSDLFDACRAQNAEVAILVKNKTQK